MPLYNQYDAKDIWSADALQGIIDRNAGWLRHFLVAGIKSVLRDGRPLLTEKISEQDRLANLLNAPPAFWDALQTADPEAAANLVATVIKARMKGKIPQYGPLADMAVPEMPVAPTGLPQELPQAIPPQGPPQAFGKATSASGATGPGAVGYSG